MGLNDLWPPLSDFRAQRDCAMQLGLIAFIRVHVDYGRILKDLGLINNYSSSPRARMGYESIAHEAEGRMGY